MSHSYAHGYEEESHEIAVGRTRSRGHSSTAAESVKAADIDDVESISDTTTIVDERDFKHKQVRLLARPRFTDAAANNLIL